MVKKIVIENQRGVDPKFNLWTMEAVDEMLDLFPEFKDKFAIEALGNYKPKGSEISQDAFDNLPDNDEKKLYIRLPSGKYLVPYASTDWYIERTRQLSENNGFDLVVSGEPALFYLRIANDDSLFIHQDWVQEMVHRGIFVTSHHNHFINASLTDEDIKRTCEIADDAFKTVRKNHPECF